MSGRKLVVNFQAFDEREMHRKMVGAMVYSLLLFGLVIYLWENETFAIAANSNGLRGALWARAIKNEKKPPGEKG